jgi:hypothetical protein
MLSKVIYNFSLSFLHRLLERTTETRIYNIITLSVPGPSLFQVSEGSGDATRDFGPYKNYHGFCERLRVVVVKNIHTMAVIFKRYFVDALKESGENGQNGHAEPIV